jgi:NAD(P)H-hydrate epimerase
MKLYGAGTMRAADQRANEAGFPSLLLMEAAGRAVARVVSSQFPGAHKIAVLTGKGNNGGDGLAAARWLASSGYGVQVYGESPTGSDALEMHKALELWGVPIAPLRQWQPKGFELIVDGLFGTGLTRPLAGEYIEIVETVNSSHIPVVAIDIPSGLPYSPHIEAELTVALAGLKHEHVFYPARAACGKIVLDQIGFPPDLLADPELPDLLEPEAMAKLLPARPGNSHKGSVGRVLIAGGYATYTGAPVLATLAAYGAGAGLVTLAYPQDVSLLPPAEAVRRPLSGWTGAELQGVAAEAAAVGMGTGPQGQAAALAVLELGLPTVIDADALHPGVVKQFAQAGIATIITPHPGEAARLLGRPAQEIAQDPLSATRELARALGVVVVLKGGPTVIASPEHLAVTTSGGPQMATAGAGDVLAGVIAAFLAAGTGAFEAACLGVYLHGMAGEMAGSVGIMAGDLANTLPQARQELLAGIGKTFFAKLQP